MVQTVIKVARFKYYRFGNRQNHRWEESSTAQDGVTFTTVKRIQ